jgi:hypothetical protein
MMRIAILNGRDMYPPTPAGYEVVKPEGEGTAGLDRLIAEVNDGAFDAVFVWHAQRDKPLELIRQIKPEHRKLIVVCGLFAWEYQKQASYSALQCVWFIDARYNLWDAFEVML